MWLRTVQLMLQQNQEGREGSQCTAVEVVLVPPSTPPDTPAMP
jgi:hypothetical protein